MSKNSKILLAIVIVIAIALIAWCYFGTTSSVAAPTGAPVGINSPHSHPMIPASSTPSSDVAVSGLTTSSSDDSNAALNSDMSVISTQSAAMDQDSAAANQSDQATQ